MDFTIKQYQQLLTSLQHAGFFFQTFAEYMQHKESSSPTSANDSFPDTHKSQPLQPPTPNPRHKTQNSEQRTLNPERPTPNPERPTPNPERPTSNPEHRTPNKLIILRHDVDLLPQNSLRFARIQHELGITGSYYFRAVTESWDEDVILEIHGLGHEVGYHYESLTTCNGNIGAAYLDFVTNLERLRTLVPVTTICMHGSPRSPHDSKDLWKHYDYRTIGILGEPYFDLDFNKFFYLTDTGRRWDGWRVSVRDKVPQQDKWVGEGLVFRSSSDIIKAANEGRLPSRIMMTFHPQRWNDKPLPWIKELLWQGVKNVGKRILVQTKKG